MAEDWRPDGQPMCAVWAKASLLCGTQVTRVRIYGGVVYSFISQGPIYFLFIFYHLNIYLYFVMDPPTTAHMSLGAHTSAHAILGAHTSAHTSFGAHTSANTSLGAHTSACMCVFWPREPTSYFAIEYFLFISF